jgi:hypothetical protein
MEETFLALSEGNCHLPGSLNLQHPHGRVLRIIRFLPAGQRSPLADDGAAAGRKFKGRDEVDCATELGQVVEGDCLPAEGGGRVEVGETVGLRVADKRDAAFIGKELSHCQRFPRLQLPFQVRHRPCRIFLAHPLLLSPALAAQLNPAGRRASEFLDELDQRAQLEGLVAGVVVGVGLFQQEGPEVDGSFLGDAHAEEGRP